MTTRERLWWAVAVAGIPVFAALETELAYRNGPMLALLLPVILVAGAVIAWRPIVGVYLATLMVPLDNYGFDAGGSHFAPSEAIFLLAAAAFAVQLLVTRRPMQWRTSQLLFAVFLGVTTLGITFAQDTHIVNKIVAFWIAFLLISILVANASGAQVERVLLCIAIAGGVLGVVAVSRGATQEVIAGGQLVTGRAEASFRHPNVLAFYLILSLAPGLALAGSGRGLRRLLMLTCAGTIVAGLMLTLARGGIIGAAVSLLVLLYWRPFRRVAAGLLLVLAVFAVFNLGSLQRAKEVSVVRERFSTLTTQQGIQVNPRIRIWSKTPAMIAARPWFGWGAGNYSLVSPEYGLLDTGGFHYDHAHDLFLTIAAETGLIGLALFVGFLIAVGREATEGLRARGSSTYALALGTAGALIGLLVTSLAEYPPRTNAIMATIMIEVGVLLACSRLAREKGLAPSPPPPGDLLQVPAAAGQLGARRASTA